MFVMFFWYRIEDSHIHAIGKKEQNITPAKHRQVKQLSRLPHQRRPASEKILSHLLVIRFLMEDM